MSFTPGSALFGGALIGLSASALLVFNGRVAGISGILGGVVRPDDGASAYEWSWRAAFVAGLLMGGAILVWALPDAIAPVAAGTPLALAAIAGLLVGVGTRVGCGCTSGHGVCGLSRGSLRSIVAVVTFMATGMAAAVALDHVLGRLS